MNQIRQKKMCATVESKKASIPGANLPPQNKAQYSPEEQAAAIKVQRLFRGYLTRQSFLSSPFKDYQTMCKKTEGPQAEEIPQAADGNTTVYLPLEHPEFVLKKSGRKEAIGRFHQMEYVRNILRSKQCSHLMIPGARLCGEFIIERRLPINSNNQHNMQVYLENLQLFDEPVREMVRLFSKTFLSDLISWQALPLGNIEGVRDYIRFDNLPLYIEEVEEKGCKKKRACIGFVDLEHIQEKPCEHGLSVLGRIFSHHKEVILDEARKMGMRVNSEEFEKEVEKGQKYYQVGYSDHKKWIEEKNILSSPLDFSLDLDQEKLEAIVSGTQKRIIGLNNGKYKLYPRERDWDGSRKPKKPYPGQFLKGDEEAAAKEVAKTIVHTVIGCLKEQIDRETKKSCKKLGGKEPTMAEILVHRSPVLQFKDITRDGIAKFKEKATEHVNLGSKCFDFKYIPFFKEQVVLIVLDQLVEQGIFMSYDPGFWSSLNHLWVRF